MILNYGMLNYSTFEREINDFGKFYHQGQGPELQCFLKVKEELIEGDKF